MENHAFEKNDPNKPGQPASLVLMSMEVRTGGIIDLTRTVLNIDTVEREQTLHIPNHCQFDIS